LVYDASVRLRFAILLIVAGMQLAIGAAAQDNTGPSNSGPSDPATNKPSHGDNSKHEPKYDQTFSGPIIEITETKITVSRSILGKPAEKRSFAIKSDTRIEGKLKVRVKVTVGYVTTDDGDVARLVVVRASASQKQPDKK
jgi:hypothetical protein